MQHLEIFKHNNTVLLAIDVILFYYVVLSNIQCKLLTNNASFHFDFELSNVQLQNLI